MRTYLAWALIMQGAFSDGERELAAAVEEARQLPQRWGLALVLAQKVKLLLSIRGAASAEPGLDELERISAGVDHYMAVSMIERGWLLAARGDPAAGLLAAREGRSRRVAAGTRLHLPYFLRVEAAMLLRMDRASEALETIEAAKKIQIEIAEHWDDCEFHRQRGEVLIALGQVAAGQTELVAAMRVSQQRGQHLFGLRASVSLAALLERQGETAAAGRIVHEARALVEDDPTELDVAAADLLLARLAVAA